LRQRLQRELQRAVEREDYEHAAVLRDRLADMSQTRAVQPAAEEERAE
jgi:protein-arginine kinase activator protein McsA